MFNHGLKSKIQKKLKNRDILTLQKDIAACIKQREYTFELTQDEAQDLMRDYAGLICSCLESTLEIIENDTGLEKVKEMKLLLDRFQKIQSLYYKIV